MQMRTRPVWIAAAAFAVNLALSVSVICQSQDDSAQSVAEAARKAKERKKAAQKEKTVITDDTLNLRPASADATGAPPAGTVATTNTRATSADNTAAPTDAAKTGDAPSAKTAGDTEKEKAELTAEVAKAKELLAQAQEALDLLKRRLVLDSDSFNSNPDRARDTAGKAKLDELQNQINEKQNSVADLKSKLADLMQKAGISPGADKPSSSPQH